MFIDKYRTIEVGQNFKIFVKNSTIWIATNDTISLVNGERESSLDEVRDPRTISDGRPGRDEKLERSFIPSLVASSIPVNILQRQVWIDDLQIIYQSLYSNLNIINL